MTTNQTPEQRLEAAIGEALERYFALRLNATPHAHSVAKAAILAAVTAELRAIIPEKKDEHPIDPMDGRPVEVYGYEAEYNSCITTMITNAKARGIQL